MKKTKLKINFKKAGIFLGFGLILFLISQELTFAQDSLGGQWDKYLRDFLPGFGSQASQLSGEDLALNLVQRGIGIVRLLIGAVALIFGTLFGLQFIFSQGNSESVSKAGKNFLWLITGFIIIMVAENIANLFNPETATSEQLIDFEAGRDQLRDIANYLRWLIGSAIALYMTISGIRMITAGGNEETINKQKSSLVSSGIGILVLLLAGNIVDAIYVVESPTVIRAAESTRIVSEIGGLIRLILAFLAPLAVVFTIFSGYLYLVSFGNEEQLNQAKRMLAGGITGIIIIYSAFAIVNTLLASELTQEICSNQIDDDSNGLIDCQDNACITSPLCINP